MDIATELERFVSLEASLLDEGRYEDWLALLAEDIDYWVPNFEFDGDPLRHGVIVRETLDGLKARVARLRHPANPATKPSARTIRFLTNFVIEASPGRPEATVRCNLLLYLVKDASVVAHPAKLSHRLCRADNGWRIAQKKVNFLTNALALGPLPLI